MTWVLAALAIVLFGLAGDLRLKLAAGDYTAYLALDLMKLTASGKASCLLWGAGVHRPDPDWRPDRRRDWQVHAFLNVPLPWRWFGVYASLEYEAHS